MSGSLGSIARIGLQLAATAYFGPIGGVIAGVAGSLLFPEKLPGAEGPRLGPDQGMTSAQIGQAIPILFGTIDVNGNVIQDLGRVEIENTEEQGGKGGPTQEVTTYTYTRTYAVLLADCQDNRPIGGLLRIWRNAKLVYDVRSQQAGESDQDYVVRQAASQGFAEGFTLYLGTSTQTADPTLEAAIGVGLQPAYRHRAYIVFIDEDVTDNGGRTSQWKFEVVCNGTFNPTSQTQYSNSVLYPWVEGTRDPRDLVNGNFSYFYDPPPLGGGGGGGVTYDNFADAIAAVETTRGFDISDTIIGWSIQVVGSGDISPYNSVDPQEYVALQLRVNSAIRIDVLASDHFFGDLAAGVSSGFSQPYSVGIEPGEFYWWTGKAGYENNSGVYVVYPNADAGDLTPGTWSGLNNCSVIFGCPYPGIPPLGAFRLDDSIVGVTRLPSAPPNPCNGYPSLPENSDYCVIGSEIVADQEWVYTSVAGGFKVLQQYGANDGIVTSYPLNPVLPVGHASDTSGYWTPQYNAAVLAGTAAPGKTYQANGLGNPALTYPILQDWAYTSTLDATEGDPDPVTLASIVTTICRRSKPLTSDDIDVSMLDETVQGYRVDRVMSARSAIDPLRQYGYFDCVDGAILSFPTRGRASVATLDDDTLGTSDGDGMVPNVTPTLTEAPELPRFVGIRYPMPHADYVVGMQQTERGNVDTVNKSYVDVAIAMSDDKAKQMTEVLMGEAWVGRETYKLSISPRLMAIEAADAIEVPVAGELQRMVIQSIEGGYPGALQTEARRDDQYIYISTAAGVASGIRPQDLGIAGLTVYALIDSTALTSNEDDAGFYVAAYGTGDRWRGASLYESMDAGANYSRVLSVSSASTMGTIDSALPVGPHHIWDEFNTLTVTLGAGTLESRTEAAVLNGANAAFIGGPDRWELIQFRTATLIGEDQYQLSGLLRGRRGTEWAIGLSETGDTFALATTLARVQKSDSAIGMPRLYKMVTSRTLLEAADSEAFTPAGVALETYAPAHVTASRDVSNNITLTWVRRSRLGPEWLDYSDVPLNEESERYQVDVLDAEGEVIESIETTSPTAAISGALYDAVRGFGDLFDPLEIRVQLVRELGGFVYGIFNDSSISIRVYTYDAIEYTYEAVQNVPGDTCSGMLDDGTNLFVTTGGVGGGVYRFEPSGITVGSYTHSYTDTPGGLRGIALVGSSLWVARNNTFDIELVELDSSDLTEISTINVASILSGNPTGIATDGTDLYVALGTGVARFTTAGSIVWQTTSTGTNRDIVYAAGNVFMLTVDALKVFDADTGALVAAHNTYSGGTTTGPVEPSVVVGLNLYVVGSLVIARARSGSTAGYIFFDAATGAQLAAHYDGLVYCGQTDGHVILSTASGGDFTHQIDESYAYGLEGEGSVQVNVYQMSAIVGRGYPNEATV